jgi:hypothetical protein
MESATVILSDLRNGIILQAPLVISRQLVYGIKK